MTRAGESAGRAVGTGLRAARRGAVRAGHASADAASQWAGKLEGKLAERGVTADHVRGVVADRAGLLVERAEQVEKQTRRSRRKLAKRAKAVRKDVAKATERARKEAGVRAKDIRKAAKQARKEFGKPQKSSRKWPWVLGLLTAGAVAGWVALNKRPQEVLLEEEAPLHPLNGDIPSSGTTDRDAASRNGRVTERS